MLFRRLGALVCEWLRKATSPCGVYERYKKKYALQPTRIMKYYSYPLTVSFAGTAFGWVEFLDKWTVFPLLTRYPISFLPIRFLLYGIICINVVHENRQGCSGSKYIQQSMLHFKCSIITVNWCSSFIVIYRHEMGYMHCFEA